MIKNRKLLINSLIGVAAIILLAALAHLVMLRPGGDRVVVLQVSGIHCSHCGERISDGLKTEPGVASVSVDSEKGEVMVGFDSTKTNADAIAAKVTGSGFGANIKEIVPAEKYRLATGVPSMCGGGCCRK